MTSFGGRTLASGAASAVPLLVHGRRRVKEGSIAEFKERFSSLAASSTKPGSGVHAMFAFADPTNPLAFWHVFWSAGPSAFSHDASQQESLAACYESTEEDPDCLNCYGGWSEGVAADAAANPSVRYRFHAPMAGFIKADDAGVIPDGPPLIGFTYRHVKPGQMDALATSFQTVCDLWRAKVPGILGASVSRDPEHADRVHDIRLFANHDAYVKHADKSDDVLMAAMGVWFANYDTSRPFTGEIYAPDPNDERLHKSSVASTPAPPIGLTSFRLGAPEMLGPVPTGSHRGA